VTLIAGCDSFDQPPSGADKDSNVSETFVPTESQDQADIESDETVVLADADIAKQVAQGMTYTEVVDLLGTECVSDGGGHRWFLTDGSILGVFLERGDSDGEMVVNHAFIYSIVQTGEKCPQSIDEISSISLNAYGWMNLELDLEENESEIKKIIEYINEADGTPTESTKGWYGGEYAVTIVKTNGEEYSFFLFSENRYSTSEYRTSDGYGAFVHQDVSEFINYIKETFPDECFETGN
jgi:hypothetical protein